jgi:hypothetical protein
VNQQRSHRSCFLLNNHQISQLLTATLIIEIIILIFFHAKKVRTIS